jgi:competence protein ComGC
LELLVLRVRIGILLLAVSTILLLITPSVVSAQRNVTESAISAAQSKLLSCFEAAKLAEKAGANISQLTAPLNNAGLLLSQAELAYSNGDFEVAQNLTVQCQSVLSNFISNATALQTSATQNRNTDFLWNIVGSAGGTVVVLVGSALVWLLLKRKFKNSEVGNRESDTI